MCTPHSGSWPGGETREGELTTITSGDGTSLPLFIARPDGPAPWPTVLIMHDYFDPEHFYHQLARRYAGEGFLAVVPSLFHRQGPLSEQTDAAASARIAAVTDAAVFDDVRATLRHLEDGGMLSSAGVTGFCWGGRMTYLLGARFPELKVLMPFYGHLAAWSAPDGPKPHNPLAEADRITAPVVGSYGGADPTIPLADVAAMEARLRDRGVPCELKIYEGCPHGFFRDGAHPAESGDAWERCLTALRRYVAAPLPVSQRGA